MSDTILSFEKFLDSAFEGGSYATDDVIAFVMPLFEEVLSFHEAKQVAPFEKDSVLFITEKRIDIAEEFAHSPKSAYENLQKLFSAYESQQFEITGKVSIETDVDHGNWNTKNLLVNFLANDTITHPAYIRGYNCFETQVGHHDEQTDIFCLGLVLGSMALGLDLYEEEDVNFFSEYRSNPVQFNNRIHPVISTLITEMTELDRRKRSANLYDIIERLKNYREYEPEKQTDLSQVAGWVNKESKERNHLILNKLRNRLFDTSRRNRLLYYKPNMRFVNMTVSSVPIVLHYQSIRPELLFTWNSDIAAKVTGMKEIVLNKYLRFEDHTYLTSSLDKIRSECQRDKNEFGFSQLKLVIAFLNWHNLKEFSSERIQSPLLLVPVELKKTKRLKEDHFTIKSLDSVVEVNPVLANQLKELYGIKVPDFVDLNEMSAEQFYQLLKSQIDAANQGIQLHYTSKPKIKLVHSVAKQTMNSYKRRLRKNGNSLDSYKNIAYSYHSEHYKPLGLEIFRQRIEPRATFLEFLINDDIKLTSQQMSASLTKERELYELAESENNPYSWEYDVCNIVLGNFNYKKMSLVRDYNQISDNNINNIVFNSLFSDKPKALDKQITLANQPAEWYHVITADPTQTQAVLHSRTGESYIIQGPPGTGKSQTITNLIADFVARGKSILFVCEKRAALDVVYHRLKQNNLDELCCYIHDSQGDKREFIKNLKTTYEDFSQNRLDLFSIEKKREALILEMNEAIQTLQQFHNGNANEPGDSGISVRKLIERMIELKHSIIPLDLRLQEIVPSYTNWIKFGEAIKELSSTLEETGAEPQFADHPFGKVNESAFMDEQPVTTLQDNLTKALSILEEINILLKESKIDNKNFELFSQLKNLIVDSKLLYPLAEYDNLALVNTQNSEAKIFDKKIRELRKIEEKHKEQLTITKNWKEKINEQDLVLATNIASSQENSFFRFLNGSWRKLKEQLEACYDFGQHQVKPKYSQILNQLHEEYIIQKELKKFKETLQSDYSIENIDLTYLSIETLRNKKDDKEITYLLDHPERNQLTKQLVSLEHKFSELETALKKSLNEYETLSLSALKDTLESILMNLDNLPDLLPALKRFSGLPVLVKKSLRTISMGPAQAEACMANKTLEQIYQGNKNFKNIDQTTIEKAVTIIKNCYSQLLKINADFIRAGIRKRFLEHIELSNTTISQLDTQQRNFKKNYNEGRKIVENEFSKSMRYKSIRELSTKESGLVLKDIKPVWLMSPLSVSDSLPLDKSFFDVVIFDEASQITLEEGIPALFRSEQTIIVGDDKQMPPTNFFTAKAEDPDDLETTDNSDENELLSMDSDSLLVQGSRKLSSTMLSWHYRSRFETLISYSNHAFYDAGLLTIPDKTIHHKEKQFIEIRKPEDAISYTNCLFDRSISFHYHTESIYEQRTNLGEARYIAELVRELLKRKVEESIGIVAFSQEQQHAIEDALTQLAEADKEFESLIEEAYERTEEDQFVGLIVKNLENIQGDERDIIIMSVCYGFDSNKKMIMNFGPINKRGGEKRLNVLFSRAKKHMAVVSSIKHFNITNEYNEGANYFRRFLHYAENISAGNMQMARTILDGLTLKKSNTSEIKSKEIVAKEIKQHLEQAGYEVEEQIGQSGFRCSLAIKAQKNDEEYCLGILIDDDKHYLNDNLVEQYYQRPAILKAFGWKSISVFAKDWLHNPEKVIGTILKKINEQPEEETDNIGVSETIEPAQSVNMQLVESTTPQKDISVPIPGFENMNFTRLISTEGGSNKFWEVAVQDTKMVIRFGKTGTKGQVQVKNFPSNELAENDKNKMIEQKKGKGYTNQ